MSDLLQRADAETQNRRLFKRGEKILAAVSGGSDSMVLLYLLRALSQKWRWKIAIAHFNHQLRGRASDADETLVRQTAARLKLPLVAGRADVKGFAQRAKLSIEMAARKLRHEFLARAARTRKISTVALAHQADDQVELFFLRLLRGAGGEGLGGMKWRSRSPADAKVMLVRPLLGFAKAELLAWTRENEIRFRDDATNFSSGFLRSRIRNELLPLLRRKYQPGLTKAVLRLMEITGTESDFVGKAARHWLRQRQRAFAELPVAVQRRVLQMQVGEKGIAADFELIERLRLSPRRFVSVSSNTSVARDESGKIKLRSETETGFNSKELAVNLSNRTGETVFGRTTFIWRIQTHNESQRLVTPGAAKPKREFFDADRVGETIVLRHWRPGDRFQPIGMKAAVKLQDMFVNTKVARARRRSLIVAAAASGEIFWVEGLRIGEHFKVTPQTNRCLRWRWRAAFQDCP